MCMKKKLILGVLLSLLFFPSLAQGAPSPGALNAGFISGIWYSTSSFFIGDTIRIYSAMQNNSGFDIIGSIHFYNGQNLIGTADFSVIDRQLIERWADWTVTPGTHNIYAKIVNPRKSEIGKEPEPISLAADASVPDVRIATIDPNRLAPEIPNTSSTTPTTTTTTSPSTSTDPSPEGEEGVLDKLVESVKKITDALFGTSDPPNSETGTASDPPDLVETPGMAPTLAETNDTPPSTTPPNGFASSLAAKLIDTKNTLDQRLGQDTNPKPITLFAKPLASLEKKFNFLKIPPEYIPTTGRLYSWFLGLLITILSTWWLLLLASLLILRWIWKIFRFFYFRNRE